MAITQEIRFEARDIDPSGAPVYQPGDRVAGTVTIVPDADASTRGVQLWVGCKIHGSGTGETVDIQPEAFIYEGDLQAGMPINASFSATLPDNAPLSYQGRRVKFDWQVTLRVDIAIWPDKRYSVPFVVVPRQR
jgi:hypothetical protein